MQWGATRGGDVCFSISDTGRIGSSSRLTGARVEELETDSAAGPHEWEEALRAGGRWHGIHCQDGIWRL
jgi:hypothetical protein